MCWSFRAKTLQDCGLNDGNPPSPQSGAGPRGKLIALNKQYAVTAINICTNN